MHATPIAAQAAGRPGYFELLGLLFCRRSETYRRELPERSVQRSGWSSSSLHGSSRCDTTSRIDLTVPASMGEASLPHDRRT